MAKKLFNAKSTAFFRESAGAIFWNFKTEAGSYQWDFLSYINLISSYTKENVNYKSDNDFIQLDFLRSNPANQTKKSDSSD
jgi:hypothetical protein